MTEIAGRIAFVTGAASGLGFAMACNLARRGAAIMLSDRNEAALAEAENRLKSEGAQVASVLCDVTEAEQMRAAAEETLSAFGKIHLLVNNAGVAINGQAGDTPLEDWRWIVDINLMGVVHGVEVFTPLIREHGEGGHILNTASMAGHVANPGMSPYTATKYAVLGYSESLYLELSRLGIGVSVLCPGWVKTSIHTTGFGRPSGSARPETALKDPAFQQMASVIEGGLDADAVAGWVSDCIEANRLYIFTHEDFLPAIDKRFARIQKDYQAVIKDGRFRP